MRVTLYRFRPAEVPGQTPTEGVYVRIIDSASGWVYSEPADGFAAPDPMPPGMAMFAYPLGWRLQLDLPDPAPGSDYIAVFSTSPHGPGYEAETLTADGVYSSATAGQTVNIFGPTRPR